MRRSVTLIAILVLLTAAGAGWWWLEGSATIEHRTRAAVLYQPAAWQVQFDNGGTALLLGTIHVGKPDFYPLPAAIAQPLSTAPCLVMELDLSDPQYALASASAAQRFGYLPADLKLSTLLPAELWPQVDAAARRIGLVPAVSERMEPWLLATTVQVMALASLGYQPALGVDQHLAASTSRNPQQTIIALESVEQQLAIIASDRAGGIEMLRQLVVTDAAREGERLVNAWRQGDVAEFEALLNEAMATGPGQQLMIDLLVNRNRNWAEQLQQIWMDDHCSVAVGALHLVGQQSLIALLRERGYQIEPLAYGTAHED